MSSGESNPVASNEFESLFAADGQDQGRDRGETGTDTPAKPKKRWKVIIVDDENDVHDVTRMALADFSFEGHRLEFVSAYSGEEAKDVLRANPDAAAVLLDVVMETEHAGLDVARYIREELGNRSIRIVLRTGQPGQAPEEKVITDYDINDYKEKTELTSRKLFTLMCSMLRGYRDIMAIEANKRGLEDVISASANIFELKSLEQFADGVLGQMSSLLYAEDSAVMCRKAGLAALRKGGMYQILAGTGEYSGGGGESHTLPEDDPVAAKLRMANRARRNLYADGEFVGYFRTATDRENFLYLSGIKELSDLDQSMIEIFARNVAIAFENVELHQEIEETQREIVYLLGEAVETRSQETGNHVKRVAEISKVLGLASGMSAEDVEILRLASPLHDLGKIGIPDSILNKPGKLTPDEWVIMKTHTSLGQNMLAGSNRRVLQVASVIAGEHHERWDGAGYPRGLRGEEASIQGRITAVADVFDALCNDRCYKKAWPMPKVMDYMLDQRSSQFDPDLIDRLEENIEMIINITDTYTDRRAA